MKKIITLLLLYISSVSMYAQFYSIKEGYVVQKDDANPCDSISGDDLKESEIMEETANIPDTLTRNISIVPPLKKIVVTSPFGVRIDPITKKRKQHKGIDLRAHHEYPVAMMYGKVLRTGYNKIAGYYVTLQHGDLKISYCHLAKIIVKDNNTVYPGTAIGLTGSTGKSTGEHLHLTIRLSGKLINPIFIFRLLN